MQLLITYKENLVASYVLKESKPWEASHNSTRPFHVYQATKSAKSPSYNMMSLVFTPLLLLRPAALGHTH